MDGNTSFTTINYIYLWIKNFKDEKIGEKK